MPVHTRNDIENIALCGTENFNKFCWWPDYPETRHALGQYWAFYRLAEYYFVSCDAGAWTVLGQLADLVQYLCGGRRLRLEIPDLVRR